MKELPPQLGHFKGRFKGRFKGHFNGHFKGHFKGHFNGSPSPQRIVSPPGLCRFLSVRENTMNTVSFLTVTLSLVGVLTPVLGFDWKNCGQPDAPAVLKALNVSPDPITIPGDLVASASGSTSVELASPLSVNVTLEKEVAGFWVKVPCVEELGSCHYQDACDILNQLIPPGQDCPEPLHSYGLPCHCPFKAGSYSLPQSDFYLPDMDLPYWLTNGNYRVQAVLGSQGKELGCIKVTVSLHSD